MTDPITPCEKTELIDRILVHWKTTVAGTCSFVTGMIGIMTTIYYPQNNSPKILLLVSGIAGYIVTLLAKDK